MKDIFELTIFNDEISFPIFEGFDEFTSDIESLDNIVNSFVITEAIESDKKNLVDVGKGAIRNTIDTTRDAAKIYGHATTAGGNIIGAMWKMTMEAIRLIVKITSFILDKLSYIPRAITAVLQFIQKIPPAIVNKIKGNINIYLTPDAIAYFYSTILKDINNFLANGEKLTETDTWSLIKDGLLHKIKDKVKDVMFDTPEKRNDKKYLDEMNIIAKKLKALQITPTVVELKSYEDAALYFSDKENLHFNDYKGNSYNVSYFKALLGLIKEITDKKGLLTTWQESFKDKVNVSSQKGDLIEFPKKIQELVYTTIQNISIVINVIGNLMSCIIKDMETIKKNYNKISTRKLIDNPDIVDAKTKK